MAYVSPDQESISVILVTCNSSRHLRRCLLSVKRSAAVAVGSDADGGQWVSRCQVVVVDNGSEDESLAAVAEVMPEALVVSSARNLGFAAAANAAAEEAVGDWLLFVNPDAELDHDAVANLLETARRYDDVGALGPRVRNPDGSFQPTCRQLPTTGRIIFSRGSVLSRLLGDRVGYTLPDYDDVHPVPAVAGTVMMLRRSTFNKIGGFDRRFFLFMEDTDLCRRLQQNGYTNYYVPGAGAVHHWGEGSSAGRRRRAWWHHRSVWRYFRKHHRRSISVLVLPFLLGVNLMLAMVWPGPRGRER